MSESDDRIAFLRQLFEHYLSLPRHQETTDFQQQLNSLQQWEIRNIGKRHQAACHADKHYAAVLNYYLEALHSGLNLQGMVQRGPDAIENARKLNKAYPLFANAIEFSVITAEIEDHMVLEIGDTPITEARYASAVQACADLERRKQRLALLVTIGHQVAPHLRSRLIHTGFKMLKGVFVATGLGEIHGTLDQGFRQLRGVPQIAQNIARLAAAEEKVAEDLNTGTA